jgi:hypothetical protein
MSLQTNAPAQNNTATENATQPAAVDTSSSLAPLPPLPPAETTVSAVDQPLGYRKPGSRSRFRSQPGERNVMPQPATNETVQSVAAAPAKPNAETRADAQPKAKDSSPLTPQMIAPAKTATPKGKVIQWP